MSIDETKSKNEYERVGWVDLVKIIACFFVVTGHFYQSMVKAGILNDSVFYSYFNETIYLFHVQLFFICSGYLYQRFSKVNTLKTWSQNILKKLVGLGIPYIAFTYISWVLKVHFKEFINGSVLDLKTTLLIAPMSPYWYLYCLILIFVITPTFSNKYGIIMELIVSALLYVLPTKIAVLNVYIFKTLCSNLIWFVLGMALCFLPIGWPKICQGVLILIVFIILSIMRFEGNISIPAPFMTVIACVGIIHICLRVEKGKQIAVMERYAFPVFLMHTIFASGIRILLITSGIREPYIHVVLGMVISFVGPAIVYAVAEKINYCDILISPLKYIKFNK